MSIFGLHLGLQLSFEHISARKNLFLSECFCWASRLSLREMDQKFRYRGTIGYGDSYLEFLFRLFKVFRLYAILLDAAGGVRAQSGKAPGYCYMMGRIPKSSSHGHVTGLLFCLLVKLFLPSISIFVNFWSSMSSIVLDIDLAYVIFIGKLWLLLIGMFSDTHCALQKSTNPQSKQFGVQETCTETEM